jgi:hypothetical protein
LPLVTQDERNRRALGDLATAVEVSVSGRRFRMPADERRWFEYGGPATTRIVSTAPVLALSGGRPPNPQIVPGKTRHAVVSGRTLEPELAIASLLAELGWGAVWVNAFGRRGLYDQRRRRAILPSSRAALFERLVREIGWGGFWDVLAWDGAWTLFAECKDQSTRDEWGPNQVAFYQRAVREPRTAFLKVHWNAV